MSKCDLCINSRLIISENGYHPICCLSEKEATECILNDYSRFFGVTLFSNTERGEKQMSELKHCPFCGGKARIMYKQGHFYGRNGFGNIKAEYKVYIKCNKCHARGGLVTTEPLIDPNPYLEDERIRPYVLKAAEIWNEREKTDE